MTLEQLEKDKHQVKNVRPDAKGRITLGEDLTRGVSSFEVYVESDHRIVLVPLVEVPLEMALGQRKEVLR